MRASFFTLPGLPSGSRLLSGPAYPLFTHEYHNTRYKLDLLVINSVILQKNRALSLARTVIIITLTGREHFTMRNFMKPILGLGLLTLLSAGASAQTWHHHHWYRNNWDNNNGYYYRYNNNYVPNNNGYYNYNYTTPYYNNGYYYNTYPNNGYYYNTLPNGYYYSNGNYYNPAGQIINGLINGAINGFR
eukprot:TRINITY_DN73030_c0_g1_i1.p1 TRINITY_DN73030_c0_g1~~TRINITY_DN73030_c0_g1_i1.p1  ORF type:complete len:189 (+),score=18.09 TRINITY_DN73030_c0_g1_i1:134-700(+)